MRKRAFSLAKNEAVIREFLMNQFSNRSSVRSTHVIFNKRSNMSKKRELDIEARAKI